MKVPLQHSMPPRGWLATPGDSFSCHNHGCHWHLRVEDRGAEHPTVKDSPPQLSVVQGLRSHLSVLSWGVGAISFTCGQPPLGRSGGRKPEQGVVKGPGRVLEKDGRGGLPSGWD